MAKNSIFAPMIKLNIQTIKRWANIMVNPGESRNEYDNKKPSSWDIDQFKSWFEDQLDSKGHPSQLLIKMLGVPDEDLFEEWSIGPTGLNNDKNWKKYQNFGGAVYDIWEYIQKYLPKTESKMTKKQIVENKIREIVKNVLKEGSIESSYIRQIIKKFKLQKIGPERAALNSKSDIPKIQNYLRVNNWKQDKIKKDIWRKDNMVIKLDSIHGVLKIEID